jgi:hypothetical protein
MRSVLLITTIFAVLTAPLAVWAAPDRVVMSQFAGFKNGMGSTMTFYVKGKNGWQDIPSPGVGETIEWNTDSMTECLRGYLSQSLFMQSQTMAINKFIQTGLITPEVGADLLKKSVELTDRPITFFNYLADSPPPDGLSGVATKDHQLMMGIDYQLPLVPGLLESPLPKKGYVHASLYLIAGQKVVPSPDSIYPISQPLELPWAKDEDFADYHFDRTKYPLVWEIGRGARTEPGEFPGPHVDGGTKYPSGDSTFWRSID